MSEEAAAKPPGSGPPASGQGCAEWLASRGFYGDGCDYNQRRWAEEVGKLLEEWFQARREWEGW